jgi:hypothetical protein
MTEQSHTPQQAPEIDWAAARARLDEQHRASIERASHVQNAWESPAARSVQEVVRTDGNVPWREFVSHCGGILKVCELVDADGRADTTRIIPLVDELFGKHATKEFAGGVTFTQKPANRPYVHSRALMEARAAQKRAEFPGDNDPEQLLRAERENALKPRTTHPR